MLDTPRVTRTYRNHHLDSTCWQHYRHRPDDIVVSTSYKAGTTWMQSILLNLIFGAEDAPWPFEVSHWLDMRLRPVEQQIQRLEAQQHRRVIKTHLPLDGLPYFPEVKYVVVARDARDVFMSLWNHYDNYTDPFYQALNTGQVGAAFPRIPSDIGSFWRQWMTRGWFPWESEGYPFWGNLHHTRTWWEYRHLPNILFVHYNDLQRDIEGEVRRVAAYLEIPLDDAHLEAVVEAVSFGTMKERAAAIDARERKARGMAPTDEFAEGSSRGGETAFIYKGSNGRWKEVLAEEDLELYRAAMDRNLPPGCARWLEQGWKG